MKLDQAFTKLSPLVGVLDRHARGFHFCSSPSTKINLARFPSRKNVTERLLSQNEPSALANLLNTTMPDATQDATTNTPLPPSVEKAYYRKCIELKRRLNEVQATNDEYKIRRVRLDRAILKMRLERAFLLDELRKRMEHSDEERKVSQRAVENSEHEDEVHTPGFRAS